MQASGVQPKPSFHDSSAHLRNTAIAVAMAKKMAKEMAKEMAKKISLQITEAEPSVTHTFYSKNVKVTSSDGQLQVQVNGPEVKGGDIASVGFATTDPAQIERLYAYGVPSTSGLSLTAQAIVTIGKGRQDILNDAEKGYVTQHVDLKIFTIDFSQSLLRSLQGFERNLFNRHSDDLLTSAIHTAIDAVMTKYDEILSSSAFEHITPNHIQPTIDRLKKLATEVDSAKKDPIKLKAILQKMTKEVVSFGQNLNLVFSQDSGFNSFTPGRLQNHFEDALKGVNVFPLTDWERPVAYEHQGLVDPRAPVATAAAPHVFLSHLHKADPKVMQLALKDIIAAPENRRADLSGNVSTRRVVKSPGWQNVGDALFVGLKGFRRNILIKFFPKIWTGLKFIVNALGVNPAKELVKGGTAGFNRKLSEFNAEVFPKVVTAANSDMAKPLLAGAAADTDAIPAAAQGPKIFYPDYALIRTASKTPFGALAKGFDMFLSAFSHQVYGKSPLLGLAYTAVMIPTVGAVVLPHMFASTTLSKEFIHAVMTVAKATAKTGTTMDTLISGVATGSTFGHGATVLIDGIAYGRESMLATGLKLLSEHPIEAAMLVFGAYFLGKEAAKHMAMFGKELGTVPELAEFFVGLKIGLAAFGSVLPPEKHIILCDAGPAELLRQLNQLQANGNKIPVEVSERIANLPAEKKIELVQFCKKNKIKVDPIKALLYPPAARTVLGETAFRLAKVVMRPVLIVAAVLGAVINFFRPKTAGRMLSFAVGEAYNFVARDIVRDIVLDLGKALPHAGYSLLKFVGAIGRSTITGIARLGMLVGKLIESPFKKRGQSAEGLAKASAGAAEGGSTLTTLKDRLKSRPALESSVIVQAKASVARTVNGIVIDGQMIVDKLGKAVSCCSNQYHTSTAFASFQARPQATTTPTPG